jgi:hypothetical protein
VQADVSDVCALLHVSVSEHVILCRLMFLVSYACSVIALLLLWAVYPADFNFGQATGASYKFYEAQRVGQLPPTNRIPWRGPALLYERSPKFGFDDLTGGWLNGGAVGAPWLGFWGPWGWGPVPRFWGLWDDGPCSSKVLGFVGSWSVLFWGLWDSGPCSAEVLGFVGLWSMFCRGSGVCGVMVHVLPRFWGLRDYGPCSSDVLGFVGFRLVLGLWGSIGLWSSCGVLGFVRLRPQFVHCKLMCITVSPGDVKMTHTTAFTTAMLQ